MTQTMSFTRHGLLLTFENALVMTFYINKEETNVKINKRKNCVDIDRELGTKT